MWYWIIAGFIFLILEVLGILSLTPLKDKYEFFKSINNLYAGESIDDISSIAYTIIALSIALFFPLVIIFIVSYFIICSIISILKTLKGKIKK